MTIKAAENKPSVVDSEISTFKQKISNAMYLYMGQMECGLRLLMERLEGIRRAGETHSRDLEKNISKDELDRFETEIIGRALSIQHTASLTKEGLTDFIQNFGSSL